MRKGRGAYAGLPVNVPAPVPAAARATTG
jgi:hypothetical protein